MHPVGFSDRKLSQGKFKYDVFDKEMLAIVHSMNKWRRFLQVAAHKTILYSDHLNLTYFKTAVILNGR